MLDRSGNLLPLPRTCVATAGMALSIWMITAGAGWSQGASPPSSPPPLSLGVQAPAQQAVPDQPTPPQGGPASPQDPKAREENPGLINEMGKIFEKSLSILPTLKSPSEAIDDLNARAKDAAKDAGESLSRLAKPSSMVTGRMKCPASANGAPDCKDAADKLCQSKGFKEGKSLNSDSAEACSAKVLIPGRTRKPDDCRTDYYVTRALCQ
ncbi:MAG: hypothetical protein E8A46_03770 [Bradyrhizobium sp.]|uniref:hypothetical protein n=1 Tax=Bradyrhizobium sp. TaxID=376 RepID=UPI0012002489|nr:hypothetical protein [Bradyrhizobium sp.]THD56364.1 MAG: hypothetical protein E8A46_03770 [Bradyrhizobium sp.]